MMTLSIKRRQGISALLMLAMLASFFVVSSPIPARAGFFSGAKSLLSNTVGVMTGLVGVAVGGVVGSVPGAIIGGVGGFFLGKCLTNWTLNHAGMIAGAVAGGALLAGMGPLGIAAGAIIGGILGNKLQKAITNACSGKAQEASPGSTATTPAGTTTPTTPATPTTTAKAAYDRYSEASRRLNEANAAGDMVAAKKALADRNKAAWEYYSAVGNTEMAAKAKAAYEKSLAATQAPSSQDAYNQFLAAGQRYDEATKKGDLLAAQKALVERNKAIYDYYVAKGDQATAARAKAQYEQSLATYKGFVKGSSDTSTNILFNGGAVSEAGNPFESDATIQFAH